MRGRGLEIGDQRGKRIEARFGFAPEQLGQRRETMLLDRVDFFLGKFGRGPAADPAAQRPEGAVALVASRAPGNLRHFGRDQPPGADPVELGQPGKGDVGDIEVEPHPDRIGGDDVIDLAILEQRDLLVARFRAQRPHHHRRATAKPAQHFGDRIDLFGTEGDDRTARRQPRQLARPDVLQRGKARPLGDLGLGNQLADQRCQRCRAQQHGLLAAARVEQPVGEQVPALAVGGQLRLVERDKGAVAAVARHCFDGAA